LPDTPRAALAGGEQVGVRPAVAPQRAAIGIDRDPALGVEERAGDLDRAVRSGAALAAAREQAELPACIQPAALAAHLL
jgi:hypothetical protein